MTEYTLGKQYVLGFIFNEDGTKILLIQKTKPSYQNGKLNGLGGSIEINETPIQAMIRETQEESGIVVTDWKLFGQCSGDGRFIYCFKLFTDNVDVFSSFKTDEGVVAAYTVEDVLNHQYPMMGNLPVLITGALNEPNSIVSIFQ